MKIILSPLDIEIMLHKTGMIGKEFTVYGVARTNRGGMRVLVELKRVIIEEKSEK